MLVLALDTSTPTITAGVVRVLGPSELLSGAAADGQHIPPGEIPRPGQLPPGQVPLPGSPATVLAEHTRVDAFGHAEYLMPLVEAALADAGAGIRDLQAVVVGVGPGPFTGLRVGMATAQALGDALDIPAYGVPSHDAVACRAADDAAGTGTGDGEFLVVTDARRREVYLSAYSALAARLHGPIVVAPAAVPQLLDARGLHPRWVSGAGADLVSGVLGLPVHQEPAPLSGFLVGCALRPLATGAVPGPLTPLYLRRPDATEPAAPKPVLTGSAPDQPEVRR